MPQYCCVPGCKSRIGGHRFPKDPSLRLKWRVAIKREDENKKLWTPHSWDVVCYEHFRDEDYRYSFSTVAGSRKRLKDNVMPSVFPFHHKIPDIAREQRRKARCKHMEQDMVKKLDLTSQNVTAPPVVGAEVTVGLEEDFRTNPVDEELLPSSIDCGTQCSLPARGSRKFSVFNFQFDARAIHYYTGFNDFRHFQFFLSVLGPAAYDLNYKCAVISPEDQLFLTLMKLRQAKEDIELSIFFGISESTVSKIVLTWINFLYFQLKELDIWPSRDVVNDTMPVSFKARFPNTRVILDATEVPIQKPSDVNSQSITFSTYKNRNTMKTMIGISPRGLVTHVSDSYGGSASDRQIIERSELVKPGMFEKHDSIMADRGITVKDLFANKDVSVNIPTMLKGKTQLEPEEVVRDRRIAAKRVHVEQVIGLGKTYKILQKDLPQSKVHLSSRIIYVCFIMSNFRNSIVNRLA